MSSRVESCSTVKLLDRSFVQCLSGKIVSCPNPHLFISVNDLVSKQVHSHDLLL